MHSEKLRVITGFSLPSVTEEWALGAWVRVGWPTEESSSLFSAPSTPNKPAGKPCMVWLLSPPWPHSLARTPKPLSSGYTGLCSHRHSQTCPHTPLQRLPTLPGTFSAWLISSPPADLGSSVTFSVTDYLKLYLCLPPLYPYPITSLYFFIISCHFSVLTYYFIFDLSILSTHNSAWNINNYQKHWMNEWMELRVVCFSAIVHTLKIFKAVLVLTLFLIGFLCLPSSCSISTSLQFIF